MSQKNRIKTNNIKVELYTGENISTYLEYHFYNNNIYNIICVQKTNINNSFISKIKFGLNEIKVENNGHIVLNGINYYTKAGVYVENLHNKIDIILNNEIIDNIKNKFYNNISLYEYLINFDYIK